MPDSAAEAPSLSIESRILLVRGRKVLLDHDLAQLYQVKAIALRQEVRRNPKRFPPDFLFELDEREAEAPLSQNAMPSRRSPTHSKWCTFKSKWMPTWSQGACHSPPRATGYVILGNSCRAFSSAIPMIPPRT
jgi:hypothetical protein